MKKLPLILVILLCSLMVHAHKDLPPTERNYQIHFKMSLNSTIYSALFSDKAPLFTNSSVNTKNYNAVCNPIFTNSNSSGLPAYFFNIMTGFKKGLSIWEYGNEKYLNQPDTKCENHFKMRISVGKTLHGAGLNLKF